VKATIVPVGRECEGIDDLVVIQGVQVLSVIQIPEHGPGVLSS
jgi:hypothetical protein